jgi:hypothetical protein
MVVSNTPSSRRSPDSRFAHLRVERELGAQLVVLARANRRTIAGEAAIAIERHIAAAKAATANVPANPAT